MEVGAKLEKIKVQLEGNEPFRANALRDSRVWQNESALRLGNFEEAAVGARELVEKPQFGRRVDQREREGSIARSKVRLGQALLGSGRRGEALGRLKEAEAYYRDELKRGASDTTFRWDFSRALYHLSRAQADDAAGRTRRVALLDEAAGVLDGLSLEAQQLIASKELIKWVAAARREAGAAGT